MFISFEESKGDFLICGDKRYFVFRDDDSGAFVIPAKCPHRGGPLNLGKFDECKGRLYCPWHGYFWSVRKLRSWGLPAFLVDGHWTVQLPPGVEGHKLVVKSSDIRKTRPTPAQPAPVTVVPLGELQAEASDPESSSEIWQSTLPHKKHQSVEIEVST